MSLAAAGLSAPGGNFKKITSPRRQAAKAPNWLTSAQRENLKDVQQLQTRPSGARTTARKNLWNKEASVCS